MKYMLVIQRVAGLSPTVMMDDDFDVLKQKADTALEETHAGLHTGRIRSVTRIHIVAINQLLLDFDSRSFGL